MACAFQRSDPTTTPPEPRHSNLIVDLWRAVSAFGVACSPNHRSAMLGLAVDHDHIRLDWLITSNRDNYRVVRDRSVNALRVLLRWRHFGNVGICLFNRLLEHPLALLGGVELLPKGV
jgi:hypothetical protein